MLATLQSVRTEDNGRTFTNLIRSLERHNVVIAVACLFCHVYTP